MHITRQHCIPAADKYGDNVKVTQTEGSVELEYDDGLTDEQILELEASSMLFALGGYTYSNLIQDEDAGADVGNRVRKGGMEETDDDDGNGDDDVGSSPEVDEESLIEGKSAYKRNFILAHRSLFSETLNPGR